MSDSDSNVSKLNGSSGFISYEQSRSEGWSSENSVDYSTQNKRNNRKLVKRRNNRVFQNVLRAENHIMSERTPPDGVEETDFENTMEPPAQPSDGDGIILPKAASTPQDNLTRSGTRTNFSEEAIRTVNFYKKFGDFWNVFPKTDYVYSKHSKWYGSEVAPGIPRIPNMCRPTYRGRYDGAAGLPSHQLQSSEYSEHEETWIVRIRRIIRTTVTTTVTTFVKVAQVTASPAVTAVSSVASAASSVVSAASSATVSVSSAASSASASVSSAATTVFSWIPSVTSTLLSAPVSGTPQEGESSTVNPWSLRLLLLLLLVPLLYIACNGEVPPPPHVPAFIDDLSQDSLQSSLERLCSPFASLWNGTTWLTSLLVNSLMMIPTLFIETSSIIYGFLHYGTTTTFGQSSAPVHSPLSTPSSSITSGELENFKLWVTSRLNELKEELAVNHRADSQKDVLDALMLIQTRIENLEEQKRIEALQNNEELIQTRIENLEEQKRIEALDKNEKFQLILEKMEKLEGGYQSAQQRFDKVEEGVEDGKRGYTENQLRIKQLDTLLTENQLKLQAMLKQVEQNAKKNQMDVSSSSVFSPEIRDEFVSIVQRLLEEYHADRTGKPDYALGSNGAAIASIRCTRPFNKRSAEYVLWGFLHWEHMNTPDIIIKPGFMPGECWAFEGANGYVAIQLSMPIFVSGFSLEHTPKELTPMGHIESAPRKFSVWGLSSLEDQEEEFLGRFEFEDNGKSLQTFDAIVIDKPFHLVELRIESNHGHLEYTCLYRFRVHGRPAI